MHLSTLETSNVDEVQAYAQSLYDVSFTAVGRSDSFHMRHHRTDHGSWTSDVLRFESGGFGISGEPYGIVSVCRLRAGRLLLTAGRDRLVLQKGDVFIMSDAGDAFTAEFSEADCAMVRLPVETLSRAADPVRATSGARFAILGRRPATTAAARRLTRVTGFAERHLADADPASDELVRAAVGHLLAATVLATFPNSLVPESATFRPRTDVSTTVALALDFVARNADLPIRSTDIAAHVMVTERALQMAFASHLSMSPTEYLRRYRLARVHEELAGATPGDGTVVTRVAARWMFTESSRFVDHYRRVFDELPSQTLRREP